MSKIVLSIFLIFPLFSITKGKEVKPRVVVPKAIFDASEKFYSALDKFMNKDFDGAYSSFMEISKDKKIKKDEQGLALYNAAFSLEWLEKYKKAIKLYEIIIKTKKLSFLFKDSYYRISACCHETKNWSCVLENLNKWKKEKKSLSLIEEFEFRVRKGTAYGGLGAYRDSVDYLESAILVLKNKKSFLMDDAKKKGYSSRKVMLLGMWALEGLAKSYIAIGNDIKISYPSREEKAAFNILNKQLDLKAYYYIKAQESYLDMLKLGGNRESVTKGIYFIGKLYQDAHSDLLKAEIPPEIKQKGLESYRETLRETLDPLLEKAETAYEKNVELSSSYKFKNKWIKKSILALEKIKEIGS